MGVHDEAFWLLSELRSLCEQMEWRDMAVADQSVADIVQHHFDAIRKAVGHHHHVEEYRMLIDDWRDMIDQLGPGT